LTVESTQKILNLTLMEKTLDLVMPGVLELGKEGMREFNGGTTCPTYEIKYNSDGLVHCTKIAAPIVGEVIKTYVVDIMKWIFL